jgi:16S rRNA (guanine(966)-N(2))-methyltransferase RsmD
MRVVGGSLRGRKLKSPPGRILRPTSDRIRESIFDLLGPERATGRRALDLFAGTGALGIEALSRGYETAVFVENNPRALELIRGNIDLAGLADRAQVRSGDVFQYLKNPGDSRSFDLVLLDPPYGKGLAEKAMEALAGSGLPGERSVVVCETEHGVDLPDRFGNLALEKHRKYGDTAVHLYVVDN